MPDLASILEILDSWIPNSAASRLLLDLTRHHRSPPSLVKWTGIIELSLCMCCFYVAVLLRCSY